MWDEDTKPTTDEDEDPLGEKVQEEAPSGKNNAEMSNHLVLQLLFSLASLLF